VEAGKQQVGISGGQSALHASGEAFRRLGADDPARLKKGVREREIAAA
jgi:hypothetical protein